MKVFRTITSYRMTDRGLELLVAGKAIEYEVESLPPDTWLTKTMHSGWSLDPALGPLNAQGGFYDVGDMSLDEIRRAGHE